MDYMLDPPEDEECVDDGANDLYDDAYEDIALWLEGDWGSDERERMLDLNY